LAWRDHTIAIKRGVERRKRETEKRTTLGGLSESQMAFQSTSVPPQNGPKSIPSDLQQDLKEYALTFLFFSFERPPRSRESHGFLDYASLLYQNAAPGSTLKMSTMAVACSLLTGWLNHGPDTPWSRKSYFKAVSAMKIQIFHTNKCSNEEMLMSILLLQFYEVRTWFNAQIHIHMKRNLTKLFS
jgi:hypothetical protein